MGKKGVVAILAVVAAIGACVGEDPSASPAGGAVGGLGQPCLSGVCLEGLVCVDAICRVPPGSSADAAVTPQDGSTSATDADGPDVSDARVNEDADTGADANTDLDAGADADANADPDASADAGTDADTDIPDAADAGTDGAVQCIDGTADDARCKMTTQFGDPNDSSWMNLDGACSIGAAAATTVSNPPGIEKSMVLSVNKFGQTIEPNAIIHSLTVKVGLNATDDFMLTLSVYLAPNAVLLATKTIQFSPVGASPEIGVDFDLTQSPPPRPTPEDVVGEKISVQLRADQSGKMSTVSVNKVTLAIQYCTPQ